MTERQTSTERSRPRIGIHAGRAMDDLRQYVREHGDARVPQRYVAPSGRNLGLWVARIRAARNAGRIDPAFERELETTIAGWEWDGFVAGHKVALAALNEFVAAYGHALVPSGYVSAGGLKLGIWVATRRSDYQIGRISSSLIAELESMPEWNWTPNRNQRLRLNRVQHVLGLLREYATEHGHTIVPVSFISGDGTRLGSWVSQRRTDHRKGKLDHSLARALESLPGWNWSPSARVGHRCNVDNSRSKLDLLQVFAAEHGHTVVPISFIADDGTRLGSWVDSRRSGRRNGSIDGALARALESLPGWEWNPGAGRTRCNVDNSRSKLDLLQVFAAAHGHTVVPLPFITGDGTRLGMWVSQRRTDRRKGALDLSLARALESLPGWEWNPGAGRTRCNVDNSRSKLDLLQVFAAEHGHTVVPVSFIADDGTRLGHWVGRRRTDHRKGTLDPELAATLKALPGWVWSPRQSKRAQGTYQP